MDFKDKKVAIICDWITDMGGAELVLKDLMDLFPNADIYTSVFFPKNKEMFEGRNIYTSFIQKLPIIRKSHKLCLTLRPLAFESFDLSEYDIVISSTSAESKGVITKPETLQICYCHTPTRYFWSHYFEYKNMMEFGLLNPIGKALMPKIVSRLRKWDFIASKRPDFFISNSDTTKKRIEKYYKREATTIYPGIPDNFFKLESQKEDYYLYVGRCIPYKKFDLIVDAFNKNGKKLKLVTNTNNKLYKELKLKSKENIEWIFAPSREELIKINSKAKAFLFPPEEDFGLVPVEAMATGTPVIAYGKGGGTETVKDGKTGIYFSEQTIESLNLSIEKFEKTDFDYEEIFNYSKKFSSTNLKNGIKAFIEGKIK